jgi:DNA invertase Pin-like site-specific DNA recombinase
MLNRKYDPLLPYRYVEYGRMSDPGQNKRSPDQQFATIRETIDRARYPWQNVRSYRDNGISGHYVKKRLGLQAMLRDIATGVLKIDLVACDTYERLGRAEEIAIIRQKLMNDHGVLVVTADTNFADPTGVVGKAIGMVESVRSTEDGRIKCHNVVRGKKDAARLKRWPGGPRPFGHDFEKIIDQSGPEPVIYSVLVRDQLELHADRLGSLRRVRGCAAAGLLRQEEQSRPLVRVL